MSQRSIWFDLLVCDLLEFDSGHCFWLKHANHLVPNPLRPSVMGGNVWCVADLLLSNYTIYIYIVYRFILVAFVSIETQFHTLWSPSPRLLSKEREIISPRNHRIIIVVVVAQEILIPIPGARPSSKWGSPLITTIRMVDVTVCCCESIIDSIHRTTRSKETHTTSMTINHTEYIRTTQRTTTGARRCYANR